MRVSCSNFDGDWNEACTFCGNPQQAHQKDIAVLEGVRHVHRVPCEPEKQEIIRRKIREANQARLMISVYDVTKFFWDKIPYKSDVVLIGKLSKRAIVGLKGYIRLKSKKRSKD